MQSQGAGFMEAVEQLAAEAGLEVPKPFAVAAAEADRRRHLTCLSGAGGGAKPASQRRLFLPEGRGALDYLPRTPGAANRRDDPLATRLGWVGRGAAR